MRRELRDEWIMRVLLAFFVGVVIGCGFVRLFPASVSAG